LSSAGLVAAARTLPERTEAAFYTAFDQGKGPVLEETLAEWQKAKPSSWLK